MSTGRLQGVDRSLPVWIASALALVLLMALPIGWIASLSVGGESGPTLAHYRRVFADPALQKAAMIAKMIAHAPTRTAALDRLAAALDRTVIAGPRTNVAFLGALARAKDFRAEKFDTGFIEGHLAALGAVPREPDAASVAVAVAHVVAREQARVAVLAADDEALPRARRARGDRRRRDRRAPVRHAAPVARPPRLVR